jgi:hypothetical protein
MLDSNIPAICVIMAPLGNKVVLHGSEAILSCVLAKLGVYFIAAAGPESGVRIR